MHRLKQLYVAIIMTSMGIREEICKESHFKKVVKFNGSVSICWLKGTVSLRSYLIVRSYELL